MRRAMRRSRFLVQSPPMRMPTYSRNLLLLVFALAPAIGFAKNKATAAPTAERCEWTRPGHKPFMGDVVGAVDRYTDLPADVRARLKTRMAERAYDEIVTIRRDSIVGDAQYGSTIRDMHFGSGRVCKRVTRAKWTSTMEERGLVYCEGRSCILVPTVCRNVSRIARTGGGNGNRTAMGPGGGGHGGNGGNGGGNGPGGSGFDSLPPTSAGGPMSGPLAAGGAPGGDGLGAGGGGLPGSGGNGSESSFAPAAGGAGGGPLGSNDASGMALTGPSDLAGSGASPASFAPNGIGQPFIGSGPVAVASPGAVVTSPVVVVPTVPTVPVSAVPEPATVLSMLAGLAALALFAGRRRSTRER